MMNILTFFWYYQHFLLFKNLDLKCLLSWSATIFSVCLCWRYVHICKYYLYRSQPFNIYKNIDYVLCCIYAVYLGTSRCVRRNSQKISKTYPAPQKDVFLNFCSTKYIRYIPQSHVVWNEICPRIFLILDLVSLCAYLRRTEWRVWIYFVPSWNDLDDTSYRIESGWRRFNLSSEIVYPTRE